MTDEMEAGRELDALVAEKVMGERLPSLRERARGIRWSGKRYSTSIADAWLVVERMHERGWQVVLNGQTTGYPWLASMAKPFPWITAHAETPAEAICRAALLAVEDR